MSASERCELIAWAAGTIAKGSRSFGMASKLLPPRERENAWLLYAWCRACDDLTDGQELGFQRQGNAAPETDLWALTHAAIHSDAPAPRPFAALREVERDTGMPVAYIEDHLRGFDLDRQGWQPENLDDLVGYCFHVAGAVGLMMAIVMGVDPDDHDTLDRASDLGIAFQLNNIARDIVDDARIGRCYIPRNWLRREGLKPALISDPIYRPQLAGFARDLHALACRYDRSARVGAARLPLRCRLAILAAANIYGAIGAKVVARGETAWDNRVSTGTLEKLALVSRAALQAARPVTDPGRSGLFDRGRWYASGGNRSAQLRI